MSQDLVRDPDTFHGERSCFEPVCYICRIRQGREGRLNACCCRLWQAGRNSEKTNIGQFLGEPEANLTQTAQREFSSQSKG